MIFFHFLIKFNILTKEIMEQLPNIPSTGGGPGGGGMGGGGGGDDGRDPNHVHWSGCECAEEMKK